MGETDWGGNWMGGAMLNKSSIQFSVAGWYCVPLLLFDLRPNYGGGSEGNGDLLLNVPCMHCCTQCPNPAAGHHWPTPCLELTGKSGSFSFGVTASFLWVLVCKMFNCALQESVSQSCVSSGGSLVGLLVSSSMNNRMISVHFQGKPSNIRGIQVYVPISNAEETEVEWFYEDLQDLLELTPKKDILFTIGDCNA